MALTRDKHGYPLPPNGALIQWAKFFITILVVPLILWFLSVERRLVVVDNTRWTMEDHNRYSENQALLHQRVEATLSVLQAQMGEKVSKSEAPPEAYRAEMNRRFDEIAERLKRLEERIQ